MSDMSPEQAAMLADAVALATTDLLATSDGFLTQVHSESRCRGTNCWVHAPSDHSLATAPVAWDASRRLAYRDCGHETGNLHPDPDAVAYATRYRSNYMGREPRPEDAETHLCDGCCREAEKTE